MALRIVNYFKEQHSKRNDWPCDKSTQPTGNRLFLHHGRLKQGAKSQTNFSLTTECTVQPRRASFSKDSFSKSIHQVVISNLIFCLLFQTVEGQFLNGLARLPYQLRRNPRSDQPGLLSQRPDPAGFAAAPRQLMSPPMPPIGRQSRDQDIVTQVILPDENYSRSAMNASQYQDQLSNSYVIDHKRFVEAVSTRCWASTILDDPASVEPSFILIKPSSEVRLNATAPIELIRQMAGFEPQKRTTIIVHGFTQSYPSTTWLRRIRALFEIHSLVGRQNLIIMDWGVASSGSYSQVAAMVSGMGSFLANFIMKLIDLGADRMSIHVIGHSLGAHLAGFAGKRIRPRLGRITALDPAGPCFGKIFSNSPSDRLSPGDAFEVDVYHYDDDFLGLPGQHGQFDVYVNGGSSQPGCTDNMNTMFQAVVTMLFRRNRVLSESHTRSTEVATVQLSPTGCQQVAYECRDYAAFTSGECGKCDDNNNQCFLMGFEFQYGELGDSPASAATLRTSFPGKRLYISTSSAEIFCSNHYQILVKFEPHSELSIARRNKWRINLELIADQQEMPINITLTNQMAPNLFSYLLLTESRPIRIRAARMQMRASDGTPVALQSQQPLKNNSPIAKSSAIRVLDIEVIFMSNINPNARRSLSSRLCPLGSLQLDEPHPNGPNSISDWPAKAGQVTGESWLSFGECFFPGTK